VNIGKVEQIIEEKSAFKKFILNPEGYEVEEGKKLIVLKKDSIRVITDTLSPSIRRGYTQGLWYTSLSG